MVIRLFYISLLFSLVACVKDKPNPVITEFPNFNHHGVMVLNEGSYGNNNADLCFIDLQTSVTHHQLFKAIHNTSLGDVAHQMKYRDGKYFISLNNSHKVIILDAVSLQIFAVIDGISFPRQLEIINDSLMVVTSLYQPKVYFINWRTKHVIKEIQIDYPNSEGLIQHGGLILVTNWHETSNKLYVLDPKQLNIKTVITLPSEAGHSLVMDKNERIWVFAGNAFKNIISSICILDSSNYQPLKTFYFSKDDEVVKPMMNNTRDQVYFLKVNYNGLSNSNGLYSMDINSTFLPQTPIIQANEGSYFYGLGIDPISSNIFLADPKGFNQKSTIYEYHSSGKLLQQYQADIGSNQFIFR